MAISKKQKKRLPIMMTPISVYRLFMRKKGMYITKYGESISNHKFLKYILNYYYIQVLDKLIHLLYLKNTNL